ncbi:hypothetical protein Tco_0073294 [Tanacetum coccineum]
MVFSVISISSDTSKESVGTSTARVILFGTIPTTIPPTTPTIDLPVIHDDTLLTPTISPTIPTIPPVAPTIQYTSPFIDTDSSNSDTPNSPPLQDPYEIVVAQWRSRVVARSSPPSSPIHHILLAPPRLPCRPVFLSVGSLPTHRLASRYPSDSSSSDSSSRHSSLGYAISDTSCDSPTSTSERPSRKRCRSPSVPLSSPVRGALSPVRADLSPPPNRIRDSDSMTNFEVSSKDGYEPYMPREVGLEVDVEDSYEPYTETDIDFDMKADINEYITYADAIRAIGMDDRDVVEMAAEDEVESRERDTVKVKVDLRVRLVIEDGVREPVRQDVLDHVTTDGAIEVIESEQRLQGHRITRVDMEVTTMTKRISMLERDNTRLRGMLDVENAINELIAKHVDEALKAYDAARNPVIEAKIENNQQDDHVEENVNHRNGNGNGNGNPNVNNRGVVLVARECTYQEFVKCYPLNFKGTEGVVGLTRWFEKMEIVFHISNFPPRYQVKYATCTLLDGALTWWNSHKRTLGVDDAYAMT